MSVLNLPDNGCTYYDNQEYFFGCVIAFASGFKLY